MAQNIDIFITNADGSRAIIVCAALNVDCSTGTLGTSPCQVNNTFITISALTTDILSIAASSGDTICVAFWLSTDSATDSPNNVINLPVTANTSGFDVTWQDVVVSLKGTLCRTSNPTNSNIQPWELFYENNNANPIQICIDTTNTCANFTKTSSTCGISTITIPPGQLFQTISPPALTGPTCVASWVNPASLPDSSPPTNITTIGPDPSIIRELISVSTMAIFSSTTYFTCTPSTDPSVALTMHNCYSVTMNVQQKQNDTFVTPNISPIPSMGMLPINIPQGTEIRLIDGNGILISGTFTVPPATNGMATVFFSANGSTNSTSCAVVPPNPSITITNCNVLLDGTLQIINMATNQWTTFSNANGQDVVVAKGGGTQTVTLPAATNMRLSYQPGETTQPFIVPNQATVTVAFLSNGTANTTGTCPAPPTPVQLTINNCYSQILIVQSLQGTTWVNLIDPGTGQPQQVLSNSTLQLTLNSGTIIRLVSTDQPMSIITNRFTVPTTTPASVFFRTDGTTSTTSCGAPTGSSSITINNCFTTTLNVQTSPDGNTWATLSGTTVSAGGSITSNLQQGIMIRLANTGETITSGSFTVPTTSTSQVFFQSNGNVSTTSCTAEERRTGLIIIIIIIIVVIIIIIIILIFVFSRSGSSEAQLQTVGTV